MSLSVSGVTPVFFTGSSQEEKLKRPSSMNWLLATGEPDAREDPNPDRIGGELVEKLDVLWSDSPRQSEAAESLGAGPLRRHRGDRLYLKQKEKSPRLELGHLLSGPAAGPARGSAALAQLRQASWATSR